MRPHVVGAMTTRGAQQKGEGEITPQRTSATNSNHQAIPRKIITVTSFGVGEGIINPSTCCSHQAS